MFTIGGTWCSTVVAEHCGSLSPFVGGVVGYCQRWWGGGGPLWALVVGRHWCWWWAIIGIDWGWWWVLAASHVTRCCCKQSRHAIVVSSSPVLAVWLLFPIVIGQLLSFVVVRHRCPSLLCYRWLLLSLRCAVVVVILCHVIICWWSSYLGWDRCAHRWMMDDKQEICCCL